MSLTRQYFVIKENVFTREYRIYKYLDNMDLKFIPKFYNYDKENKHLKCQKANGSCIADLYGEDFNNVPMHIIKKIRTIVRTLYDIGIIYPDITGYNFIEDKDSHIWIINFNHCFYVNHYTNKNIEEQCEDDIPDKGLHIKFVYKFCFEEERSWNSYFA